VLGQFHETTGESISARIESSGIRRKEEHQRFSWRLSMGRSRSPAEHPFRFFLNLSDAIATNVFLMLYPKPDVRFLLDEDRSRMEELLDCLNNLKKQVLIDGGRTYGGGLHKLEPSELANLPMLKLQKWLRSRKHAEPIF